MQDFKYETRKAFYLTKEQYDYLNGGADWFKRRLSRFGTDGYSFIGEADEITEAKRALEALSW